jgi:hypothetical protein
MGGDVREISAPENRVKVGRRCGLFGYHATWDTDMSLEGVFLFQEKFVSPFRFNMSVFFTVVFCFLKK